LEYWRGEGRRDQDWEEKKIDQKRRGMGRKMDR
jgi:hypothetical protein